MGALTLKNFPFELRGWDIKKFESIDPTDSFGTNCQVYINKNQIVQIEPSFNGFIENNNWLTDKGRQFFDGVFNKINNQNQLTSWSNLLNKIIKTLYFFDFCNKHYNKTFFFTIVCSNLSIEIVSLLLMLAQKHSFIKLTQPEQLADNNIESMFQINNAGNKFKLIQSTLCLIVSTNTRYESHYLNLNLRQRFVKGNFKCLLIGSLINLTFSTLYLGSNLKVIKTITEGNNLVCQDLKFSNKSVLIYNNQLIKRNNKSLSILKTLSYLNIFEKTWDGKNLLNSSLFDTGKIVLKQLLKFKLVDFNSFSILYFVNVKINNVSNFKKIIELKLFHSKLVNINSLILDQNYKKNKKIFKSCLFVPNSTFYENEQAFFNAEGFIKKTTKVILKKSNKNNWQIIRKLVTYLNHNLTFVNLKENHTLLFDLKNFYKFKNYISFHYYATQNLNSLSFYLKSRNSRLFLTKNNLNFKLKTEKFVYSKLKYWLDDFFTGGKDNYSQNSPTLINCSQILRTKFTNFF